MSVRGLAYGVAFGVAIGLFGLSAPASFAKELKLGHFLPSRYHGQTMLMQPWAEEVAKRSNGALTIRIFPARQLGGTPAGQYNQVLNGVSDISLVVPGYTPTVFRATGIVELPFLTKNAQHATRILGALFDEYLASEYKDVKAITFWTTDKFVIHSSTPVRRLEDLAGLKIRSPSATSSAVVTGLGAVPVKMPITKVYTSMKNGAINGFLTGFASVFSFNLMEVTSNYTTAMGGGNLPLFLLMNRKSWDALPAGHKKIIDETSGLKLGLRGAKAYDGQRERALDIVRKRSGVEVIALSQAEQAKFRKAAAPVIEDWIAAREKQGIRARAMYKAAEAVE